jgi:hypothetical protein
MRPDTRTGTRLRGVGVAVLIAACLSSATACTKSEPKSSALPVPAATKQSFFASDEEALDAARATYENFLRVTHAVLADGGTDAGRISEFAAPDLAEIERLSAERFAESNLRIEGVSLIKTVKLQQYRPGASAADMSLIAYFCVDDSTVNVFNSNGLVDRAAGSVGELTYEVTFLRTSEGTDALLVKSNEVWGGEGVC